MYRAQSALRVLFLGERRIGALGTRRNLVILAEGHVGAAIGATVGAVAGLLSGVIILHILSSLFF